MRPKALVSVGAESQPSESGTAEGNWAPPPHEPGSECGRHGLLSPTLSSRGGEGEDSATVRGLRARISSGNSLPSPRNHQPSRRFGAAGRRGGRARAPLLMNANGTRLGAITKELWNQWQQTKQYWKDAKSEEFEHKYLEELVASVDKTVMVIEQLDKLLSKIRRDCE